MARYLKVREATLLCLLAATALRGEQNQATSPETLKCYSCIDQGDHGCSPEKAEIVPCLAEHDICIEGVIGIQTSHEHASAVIKGCGMGSPGKVDKALQFHGLTFYIQVFQCNTGLCNTHIDYNNYTIIQPEISTVLPNGIGCYGCLGESAQDNCFPTTAPQVWCYNGYTSCFDGNATVTVENSTVAFPIKSCSVRPYCAKETLRLGGFIFTVQGACCSGHLCNQDLSNITQLETFPLLEILPGIVATTPGTTTPDGNSTNATQVTSNHNTMPASNRSIEVTGAVIDKPKTVTEQLDNVNIKGQKGSEKAANCQNPASMVNWPIWAVFLLATFCL